MGSPAFRGLLERGLALESPFRELKELREFKELKAFEDTGLLSLALKGCLGLAPAELRGLPWRGLALEALELKSPAES